MQTPARLVPLALIAFAALTGTRTLRSAEACPAAPHKNFQEVAEDTVARSFRGSQPDAATSGGVTASVPGWEVKTGHGTVAGSISWVLVFDDCLDAKVSWRLENGGKSVEVWVGNSAGSGQQQTESILASKGDAKYKAIMDALGTENAEGTELVGVLVCENPHSETEFYRAKVKP